MCYNVKKMCRKSSPAGRGVICEVTPIGLLAYFVEVFSLTLQSFFSHRTHRFNRVFLAHISIPQKAFGIQSSQNVSAKGGCKVL